MAEEMTPEELGAITEQCNRQRDEVSALASTLKNPVKDAIQRRIPDKHSADRIIDDRDFALRHLTDSSGDMQFAALLSLVFLHSHHSHKFTDIVLGLAKDSGTPELQCLAITALGNIYADTSSPGINALFQNLLSKTFSVSTCDALELSIAKVNGVAPQGDRLRWIRELQQDANERQLFRETKLRELRDRLGEDFMGDTITPE